MSEQNRKKALVIGATSGIGKGLAQVLVKNNYLVGITGRRAALLDDLKNEKPDSYFTQVLDVFKTDDIEKSLNVLSDKLGSIDLIIVSSGYGEINKELSLEIEQNTILTNVIGFNWVVNWSIKLFEDQGYGHLVGISSIAGLRGNKFAPAYNASKAYQINYLEGLRQKTRTKNITITDIRPGFVNTDMAKGDGLFWVATVDKAVNQMYNAIVRKKKVVYVTKRWRLIAIILKIAPRWLYDRFS